MAAPRGSSAAGGEDASATFLLLYGPLVQFSRPPGAPEPQVVAMPAALPLSVETVFRHPPSAPVPESVAHFCFCPLLKLHEPSELSFCLTDSSGAECFGVSLQLLCRHESAAAPKPDSVRRSDSLAAAGAPSTEPLVRHRPVALVLLSRRPLLVIRGYLVGCNAGRPGGKVTASAPWLMAAPMPLAWRPSDVSAARARHGTSS